MITTIYSGKIREGKPGTLTDESYDVLYDDEKKYAYLSPFPVIDYAGDAYRKLVNNSEMVEDYFKAHDSQQPGYFKFISPYFKRGMRVADCGCGGGAMLDLLKGLAAETIAIEPFEGYHTSLAERKHNVYASTKAAITDGCTSTVDLVISLHVIEHTTDPLAYLQDMYVLLKPGGTAVVFTPNLQDILLEIYPEVYAPFFFRMVHNYYFGGESLALLGKQAGFNTANVIHYHEFGLSNTMYWLKDALARGQHAMPGIDKKIDASWKNYLEENGRAYNVGVVLTK